MTMVQLTATTFRIPSASARDRTALTGGYTQAYDESYRRGGR
jgi:hypothetical protein